jgi:hypothetical protein
MSVGSFFLMIIKMAHFGRFRLVRIFLRVDNILSWSHDNWVILKILNEIPVIILRQK